MSIAFPCVYLGGASAAFYYRQRRINEEAELAKLPVMPPPGANTRLLVIAPHCDDETLGCAGLIQQTMAAGGAVKVAIVTNGDGYTSAVERQQRVVKAGPKDYVQFAALRQKESRLAMTELGLPAADTLFLGYPDRGLESLWNDRWNTPYRSGFTDCVKSPYADTFDSGSAYCGNDVVKDLRSVMRQFRPTLIVVSHPGEDHPDHAAASSFTSLALEECKADAADSGWAPRAAIRFYLIHRGDWPIPEGAHADMPLAPPAAMTTCDTDWRKLPLTAAQINRKAAEIAAYPSQTAIMPAFMQAFARTNELFGQIPSRPLTRVPEGAIKADGDARDWANAAPCIVDPARDNVLRDLQGGGDIIAVYAAADSTRLYIRITLRRPVNSRFVYRVRVRPFGQDWDTPDAGFTADLKVGDRQTDSLGITTGSQDRTVEAAIPWHLIDKQLNPEEIRAVAISAETYLTGVEIDRTATRLLTVSSPGAANP